MGITVPKINPSKIISGYTDQLIDLPEKQTFFDALREHGVSLDNARDMTLGEYYALEKTWLLSDSEIKLIQQIHPDLQKADLRTWTVEMWQEYTQKDNARRLKDRFSDAELDELSARGIHVDDTFCLFKEFHTPQDILSQTDSTLRAYIEASYLLKLDFSLGEGTAALVSKASIAQNEPDTIASLNYSLPSGIASLYEWVNFPLYGGEAQQP